MINIRVPLNELGKAKLAKLFKVDEQKKMVKISDAILDRGTRHEKNASRMLQ